MNDQAVGLQIFYRGVAEKNEGGAAKLDDDLGHALGKTFAGSKIERDAGPAPVVDLQFQRDKGFCIRIGSHVGLAAIADHALAIDHARAILPPYRVSQNVFRVERLNGV